MLDDTALTFYPHLAGGARWTCTPAEDPAMAAWLWSPIAWLTVDGTLDNINALTAGGWERTPERYLSQSSMAIWHLWGQLADVRMVHMPGQAEDDREVWARSADLRQAKAAPVALAFTVPLELQRRKRFLPSPADDTEVLNIAEMLPPPQFGNVGLTFHERTPGERGWQRYNLEALGEDAQALQQRLGDALRALATPGDWWPLTDLLLRCASPGYRRTRAELQSHLLASRGKVREQIRAQLDELEIAHERYQTMRQARRQLPTEAWLERWAEVKAMAQQLAVAYWEAHQAAQRTTTRAQVLPALTSSRRTFVPSSNAPRALMQTFGPGVQPSLWNAEGGGTIELQTPNNSLVRLDAQDANEHAVLQRYVTGALGPEGLKHLIGILDAYHLQTGGKDQKADARASLRQLVLRIKGEHHADDPAEQKKLMQTILYLARCFITSDETRYSERPRQPLGVQRRTRKYRERKEYSPLLVIERIQFEEDGSIRIPTEVVFHLGADYYELLFGEHAQFFIVPTAQLLSYHPDREQHELVLGMYLCDHITLSATSGPFQVHFHTMMIQSSLRSPDELASDPHRTRDALRAISALERLERDGIHRREAHLELDTVLAAELTAGNCAEHDLAPATLERLRSSQHYTALRKADPALVREYRRKALQQLLRAEHVTAPIVFRAGPLLREQAEKREAQRKTAQERNERALTARVINAAIPRVIDAAQNGAKPEKKQRGRPRKGQ